MYGAKAFRSDNEVPTMKAMRRMVTNLQFDLLKYVMILMVKAAAGASNLARAISVCSVFMKVAEDIDVLKAACFDDVNVSNRHGLFQRTNGLLYRCAQVGNAGAQYVLAKIVLLSSSRLLDMENEGAILSSDCSLIRKSCCGKIPMDDALVASFMLSHFSPDQGCSTTVSSQTLVHSQLGFISPPFD
ncbi:uncharacterized protein LOC131298035 isoform X2 [Rhododendron vialii]|uniref:uncharacterized protein LOC131298035 isoform X2 n=1 Tax=Rhododendron vialii TaxID=182163 RepID=UPI00265FB5E2|nr:uncharacterized protein LOC131298035 isoform X2 [Rhododendron vialii]